MDLQALFSALSGKEYYYFEGNNNPNGDFSICFSKLSMGKSDSIEIIFYDNGYEIDQYINKTDHKNFLLSNDKELFEFIRNKA